MNRGLEISKIEHLLKVLNHCKHEHDAHSLKQLRGEIPNDTDPLYGNEALAYSYFEICIKGLILEGLFSFEFSNCGKELLVHFDTPKLDTVEDVMEYFYEIYDSKHPIRFVLETMDSIQEVREAIR